MKPDGADELPLTPFTDSTLDLAACKIRQKIGQPDQWVLTVSTDDEFYARSMVGRLAPGTPVKIELDASYRPEEWSLKGQKTMKTMKDTTIYWEVWSPGN